MLVFRYISPPLKLLSPPRNITQKQPIPPWGKETELSRSSNQRLFCYSVFSVSKKTISLFSRPKKEKKRILHYHNLRRHIIKTPFQREDRAIPPSNYYTIGWRRINKKKKKKLGTFIRNAKRKIGWTIHNRKKVYSPKTKAFFSTPLKTFGITKYKEPHFFLSIYKT